MVDHSPVNYMPFSDYLKRLAGYGMAPTNPRTPPFNPSGGGTAVAEDDTGYQPDVGSDSTATPPLQSLSMGPSNDEYQKTLRDYASTPHKKPGVWKSIAGYAAGALVPDGGRLGHSLLHPGEADTEEKLGRMGRAAKEERDVEALSRQREQSRATIGHLGAQTRLANTQADFYGDLKKSEQERHRQGEMDTFTSKGGQFEPDTTEVDLGQGGSGVNITPKKPTVGPQKPPELEDLPGLTASKAPLGPGPVPIKAPVRKGYFQLPSASYDEKGSRRVMPTPAQAAQEKSDVSDEPIPDQITSTLGMPKGSKLPPASAANIYKLYETHLLNHNKSPEEQVKERTKIADQVGLDPRDRAVYIATGKIERPPTVNVNATNVRGDKSYQFHVGQLSKLQAPVDATVSRLGKLKDTLDQNSPQADALIAPELLTVMAGGQGSGLRMNEAEIARIIGGRSHWQNLQAAIQKWKLDPSSARSITPEQQQQIRALVKTVDDKLLQKQEILTRAQRELVDTEDPMSHRRSLASTLENLGKIDNGTYQSSGAPSGGGPPPAASGKSAVMVQRSKSTGAYRHSLDGGKTWLPGQPPAQ